MLMITVLAHGAFDLLHPGHLEHLRQARAMGDRLIVSVTSDEFIHKGPGRPILDESQRLEMLCALRIVDDVFLCRDASAVPAIETLRPDIYVKGPDYSDRDDSTGKFAREKAAVESYGGRVAFTEPINVMSSSALANRLNGRPIERTATEVLDWIGKARAISATVAGESIIDEYVECEPSFKSPKEDVITYRIQATRRYDGGVLMVEQNLAQLCPKATLLTGEPVTKRRYLSGFGRKVFSVVGDYEIPPLYIPERFDSEMVVVADYGHGYIRGKSRAKELAQKAPWLALMVQSNSLNWGFNLLGKWPRADYFVADEPELRLAKSDRWTPIEDLLSEEYDRLGARYGAVTLGHRGCIVYDGREMVKLPALADKIVDRMGAGDAFFAWTAPLAFLGAPPDIIAFVGNVAGGIKVGKMGNEVVTQKEMGTWINGLLK